MKSYPAEHWRALGEWVRAARLRAGYADTKEWATTVGRSSRVLLGLERGEPGAGPKTIQAIAKALGVHSAALFAILETGVPGEPELYTPPPGINQIQVMSGRVYQRHTGRWGILLMTDKGPLPLGRAYRDKADALAMLDDLGLSEPADTPDVAIAALDEGSIAGEQESRHDP